MNPAPLGDGEPGDRLTRPHIGVASSSMSVHTLPEGTRLRDHEITGLIGEGGFGIVYLAYDHSLQRRVAIKEYMPSAMASRASGSSTVVVKSERHLDTFRVGLKSFVNEARLLARFDHPSLVKVYRFWEENGTAYMAMPYYEGPTLKRALAELGRAPTEAELREWLRPLLDALAVMHAAHCFHRDIAPDNILLTPGGPLLLDFGAARRVIGDMTHALTVMLKPGFAPIEQYGEVSSMAQGAWTDLYALASVVYAAVTGHAPMSSVERLMDDRLEPLGVVAAGRYSEPFLAAVDAALALRPAERPQDVAAFRRLMDGRVADASPPPDFASTCSAPLDSAPLELVLPEPTVAQLAPGLHSRAADHAAPRRVDATRAEPAAEPEPLCVPTAPRRQKAVAYALAAAAGVVVLAMVGYLGRGPRPPASTSPPANAVPAVQGLPAPAPAPSPVASAALPADDTGTARAAELTPPTAGIEPVAKRPVPTPPRARAARPERASREAIERPVAAPELPVTGARCSDILQKASLEPLTPGEAAYLKKECR